MMPASRTVARIMVEFVVEIPAAVVTNSALLNFTFTLRTNSSCGCDVLFGAIEISSFHEDVARVTIAFRSLVDFW